MSLHCRREQEIAINGERLMRGLVDLAAQKKVRTGEAIARWCAYLPTQPPST
jgi:hypothetical protein